jgi:L-lactate dehydrogenase (cytochrome)
MSGAGDTRAGSPYQEGSEPEALSAMRKKAKAPLPRRLRTILNLEDFEVAARKHLPKPIFGYIAEAAESRVSLRQNRDAFAEYDFLPRVLIDVSHRTTRTELLGHVYDAPFGIAPMGISALSAYRGDIIQSRAAAATNIPHILSSSSLIPLEDVIRENPRAWFQAYLSGDQPKIMAMVERVARAGYDTLVITVDTPAYPNRENYLRVGFNSPLKPSLSLAWQGVTHPRWLVGTFLKTFLRHGMPHFENNYATRGAPILSPNVERDFADRAHLNWEHFKAIRRIWTGKLLVKGVLSPKDAVIAADHGADGVIVSNHGGRQLDGAVAPIRVIADVASACPSIPVMMDGGVRRGTDVLKALALGAKFVWVGRPFNYAGAIGGEAGVAYAINLLLEEISRDMAMLGVRSLAELSAEAHLVVRG